MISLAHTATAEPYAKAHGGFSVSYTPHWHVGLQKESWLRHECLIKVSCRHAWHWVARMPSKMMRGA